MAAYDERLYRIVSQVEDDHGPDDDEPSDPSAPVILAGGLDPHGLDDPMAGFDPVEVAREARRTRENGYRP